MQPHICILIAVLTSLAAPYVQAASAAKNVILFVADDLGVTDLGCFGSTFYETPHLDKLAADGMRFTSAYAACPVCSPTRASIMTGRYPVRTGITDFISGNNRPVTWKRNTRLLPAPYKHRLAHDERTIAESLHDAGYATFFAGKWHLGNEGFLPTDQGFDINKGGYAAGGPRSYFSPYKNPYLEDGPPGEHLPIRLAAEACRFIEASSEKPFFVCMPFYSVHIPLDAPPELIAKYEAKSAKLKHDGPATGRERNNEVRLVQDHALYAAVVESMDAAVGQVLDKLDELGLAEDTVVLFTSDNGGLATAEGRPTSNLPYRAGKGWLYEGGLRVPTIVRWPGVTDGGRTCASPIISNDLFPTILEMLARPLEPRYHVDGVSFAALLRGDEMQPRPLFWHYPHYGNQGGMPGGAVRDGKWKLIEWYEDGSLELYDVESDPGETKELSNDNPEVVNRLKTKLAEWREELGAKMPTENPRYRPL